MRPNFFPNTPDINPFISADQRSRRLQGAARPGRYAVDASTASTAASSSARGGRSRGREEYLDSEKYEIKAWDRDRPGNIRGFLARFNRIRRENPALREFTNLKFYNAWNDNILVYGKMTANQDNIVLIAVNLDPHHVQECGFEVPLWELGLPDWAEVEVEDLFTDRRFTWHGKMQHVWLDPAVNPTAIWRITPPGMPG